MRRLAMTLGLLLIIGWAQPSRSQTPDLGELRSALANDAIPVEERARRALDGAATLDLAAQRSTQSAERRARWSQAVGLLDEFVEQHPDVEAAPLIRFQAAVYRWAEGAELRRAGRALAVGPEAPARGDPGRSTTRPVA